MAYVTGGALAAAVSRAGGLGIVGGAYAGTMAGEPDLDIELTIAKQERFGVGFITWSLERPPDMLTKPLRYSPTCAFLSFGDPSPFVPEIANSGAVLDMSGAIPIADRHGA
jgi:nitronate monooxygenase